MGRDLAPYQAAIGRAEGLLRRHLASGRASADEIANVRRAAEIMKAQLAASPDHVLGYDRRPPDPRTGLKGPEQWTIDCLRRASDEIHPELASEQAQQAYVRKEQEYLDLGLRLVTQVRLRQQAVIDRQNGRSYLIQDNPLIPRIMSVIASELMSWVRRRPVDQAFLTRRAESGLADFLAERPDMVALLRLAQTLPADVEISEIPIERPAVVEAVELAIGLVPVVGNVVAAYEAYSGRDLFGYRLSDVERGVLAATVLLPLAGRLVKGGRVLYTEARLVALYGRDAAQWSRAVTAGGRLSANSPAVRVVEQAEVALRVDKKIGTAVAREAARALPRVVRGPGVAAMPEQAVLDLFRELAGTHRALATLDGPAMLRILEKGPNVDHLKGQVLEEVLESQVVPWLAQRAGSFALGLRTGGRPLEFVPGHLVRDLSGRQITDGILGVRNGGVLEILAVFEAKAGRQAARELSAARGGLSALNDAERAELRAYAKDVLREQRAAAVKAGQKYTRSLDDVQKEIALSETGGQVRRDIERLSPGGGARTVSIRIGEETVPVLLSPTRTKFFGVLPRDVRSALIEKELADAGFTFEIIGVDLTQRELVTIAEKLRPMAAKLAAGP